MQSSRLVQTAGYDPTSPDFQSVALPIELHLQIKVDSDHTELVRLRAAHFAARRAKKEGEEPGEKE